MKKHQLSIWLGLFTAFSVFEFVPLSTSANGQSYGRNCKAYNSGVVAAYRQRKRNNLNIGSIKISDNMRDSASIRLYHPDAPDSIFSQWDFASTESATLTIQRKPVVIGADWGIQVVFGRGPTSCIHYVGQVGRFENGRFDVNTKSIFDGSVYLGPI
jgi:hypothetical protein